MTWTETLIIAQHSFLQPNLSHNSIGATSWLVSLFLVIPAVRSLSSASCRSSHRIVITFLVYFQVTSQKNTSVEKPKNTPKKKKTPCTSVRLAWKGEKLIFSSNKPEKTQKKTGAKSPSSSIPFNNQTKFISWGQTTAHFLFSGSLAKQ